MRLLNDVLFAYPTYSTISECGSKVVKIHSLSFDTILATSELTQCSVLASSDCLPFILPAIVGLNRPIVVNIETENLEALVKGYDTVVSRTPDSLLFNCVVAHLAAILTSKPVFHLIDIHILELHITFTNSTFLTGILADSQSIADLVGQCRGLDLPDLAAISSILRCTINGDASPEYVEHKIYETIVYGNESQSLGGIMTPYKQVRNLPDETHYRHSLYPFQAVNPTSNADLCISIGIIPSTATNISFGGILVLSSNEITELLLKEVKEKELQVFVVESERIAREFNVFYGTMEIFRRAILESIYLHFSSATVSHSSVQTCPNVSKSKEEERLDRVKADCIQVALRSIVKMDYCNLEVTKVAPLLKEEVIEEKYLLSSVSHVALPLLFPASFNLTKKHRPDLNDTFEVKLSGKERLTPDGYERNVFHLELECSPDVRYKVGAALAVFPRNPVAKVKEFLSRHGLDGNQVILVSESSIDDSADKKEVQTLLQLLVNRLDLFGRPSRAFLTLLIIHTTGIHREKLSLLLANKSDSTIVGFDEMILEYQIKVTLPLLLEIPPMKPRLYSISSSQSLHPTSIHLLVVLVSHGTCTTYLNDLDLNDSVTVSLRPSAMILPPDTLTPVIMCALGTGLAPFRAFIQERYYQHLQGVDVGPMVLYFGARERVNEYLYGNELDAYQALGLVTMRLAFSRDQQEKMYVQYRMEEDSDQLENLLKEEKGGFYLCGPTWPVKDVTKALVDAFESSVDEASNEIAATSDISEKVDGLEELEKMKHQGRFVLEVY